MLVSHYDINDDEDEGRIGNDDYDVWPIFLSLLGQSRPTAGKA